MNTTKQCMDCFSDVSPSFLWWVFWLMEKAFGGWKMKCVASQALFPVAYTLSHSRAKLPEMLYQNISPLRWTQLFPSLDMEPPEVRPSHWVAHLVHRRHMPSACWINGSIWDTLPGLHRRPAWAGVRVIQKVRSWEQVTHWTVNGRRPR